MQSDKNQMRRVLVLCTGNSCRSQMAEALINHDLAGRWSASSAGTEPTGYVHPLAQEVLAELGIDSAQQASKSVELFYGDRFDVVLTVCDHAAENCPIWLGEGRRLHIPFADPARAASEDDGDSRRAAFRAVRDQIQREVIQALSAFAAESPAPEPAHPSGKAPGG